MLRGMTNFGFGTLVPGRISTQIAALIVVSVLAIHLVLTAAFLLTHRGDRFPNPDRSPGEFVPLVHLLNAATPADRAALVGEMNRTFSWLDIVLSSTAPERAVEAPADPHFDFLRRHLGRGLHLAVIDHGLPDARLAIKLSDGSYVTARAPIGRPPPPRFGPVAVALLSIAVTVTLLGLWAARGLISPLRAFATAAEGFSPDGEIAMLPERGPHEIRAAAKALNRMRERIKRLLHDRIRMLAAMGHDLRTPITRLRLRSEFIEDEALRGQMLSDLDRMRSMVESVLVFLRDGHTQEAETPVDLASSLQTICDEFADTGHDVAYVGPGHLVMTARPDALHRAVTNLIDNAVRYGGGKVLVRLSDTPESVAIAIEDQGPGIPDAQQDAMFEPFVRGDAARGMNEDTGFGLGLSIARAVIEAHGGTLGLRNLSPRGLAATIDLPRAASYVQPLRKSA